MLRFPMFEYIILIMSYRKNDDQGLDFGALFVQRNPNWAPQLGDMFGPKLAGSCFNHVRISCWVVFFDIFCIFLPGRPKCSKVVQPIFFSPFKEIKRSMSSTVARKSSATYINLALETPMIGKSSSYPPYFHTWQWKFKRQCLDVFSH